MKVRLRVSLALLAGAILLPSTTQAVKALSYYDYCDLIHENNYHGYLYHARVGSELVDYMAGEVVDLRDVKECDWNGNSVGSSLVLPVNVQGYAFVQLGYGRLNPKGRAIQPLKFLYTPDANNALVEAPAPVPAPTLGDHYFFRASFYAPTSRWRYEILDRDTGADYVWYGHSGTHHYGYDSWAGFEVYNTWDQYGGAGTVIHIEDIFYQRANENTNYYYTSSNSYRTECCGTKRSDWVTLDGSFDGHAWITGRSTGF